MDRRYQTAGFPSTIQLGNLPSDVTYEFVTLKAEDGGVSRGILYTKKGTKPNHPGGRERALPLG